MSYIIIFLIIASISACLAKIFNKKIDITIPISVMLIVLIIFPFGFFNRLDIGVYVVEAIATIALLYLIYKFIKSIIKKEVGKFFKNLFTPGLAVYMLFYIYFIYLNINRLFSSWDEFSHWGLIVKNMYIFNSYGTNPETIVSFRDYPPFTAIFEFFSQKVVNSYSEGRIIIAMNLLYISMMIPILKNIEWKKGLCKLLIYIPIIFILPLFMYSNFYTTIYVDGLLGIFMAYILYTYFSMKNDVTKHLGICLGLISLPLIKSAGSGLAIFILIIILVDIIYQYKKSNHDKKLFHKNLIYLLIYFISFIVGKFSWDILLVIKNTKPYWDTNLVSIKNIINVITGKGLEYQYITIKNFIKRFFLEQIGIGFGSLTNFTILLVFILYSICIYRVYQKERKSECKRYIMVDILLAIFYILYIISLLILYVFTFGDYEAQILASYTRYTYIPLLGMFTFNTLLICDNMTEMRKAKINYIVIIILLIAILPVNGIINLTIKNNESLENARYIRTQYSNIQNYINLFDGNTNIYYISCGSDGFDLHITKYDIIPNKLLSTVGWSLGKPRNEEDIWSKDTSVEKFELELIKQNCEFVYIYKADEIFKEKYSGLFEREESIKNETMYKVDENGNNIKLVEVNLEV